MLVLAIIKKLRKSDIDSDRPLSEQKWGVYTKDGDRLLGRHPSRSSAEKQLAAIEINKHGFFIDKAVCLLGE